MTGQLLDQPVRDAIESTLAEHAGVQCAHLVAQEQHGAEPRWVAYIVPDEAYLDHSFVNEADEVRFTEQWRKIYDLYQKPRSADSKDSGLSTQVWKSAYDRRPIPALEMQEWIGWTLVRVRDLVPTRVLEIGCGLGALLLPLAPTCERYVGTDLSGASINALKRRIEASSGAWTSVSLFERGADQLEDFADGSFDTVIINSVTMYFPSVEYLTRVLVGALRITRPNGAIFVGDVRSMPLLTTFAVSVELFQASPGLSLDELRARVRKRLRLENELFISPLYFLALRELHPQISRIDVLPKRGAHDNEMNCFRYDAVLRVASRVTDYIEPIWLDWARDSMCLATIDRLLRRQASDTLAITGIPNSRVEKDTLAGALLSEQNASDVGTLKQALEVAPKRGIHPEYLFSLADQLGYRMDFSWARAHATGSYDAVFRRRDPCDRESRLPVKWPQATFASNALSRYVVGPVQKIRNRKLVHDLRAALVARFGEHLAPTEFLIVDAIPTVTAGNADHSALPPPWLSCL